MALSSPAVDDQIVRSLTSLGLHQSGVIVGIDESEGRTLCYLASLGLVPGASVELVELAPFGGPLLVKTGRARYALGREIAGKIFIGATH